MSFPASGGSELGAEPAGSSLVAQLLVTLRDGVGGESDVVLGHEGALFLICGLRGGVSTAPPGAGRLPGRETGAASRWATGGRTWGVDATSRSATGPARVSAGGGSAASGAIGADPGAEAASDARCDGHRRVLHGWPPLSSGSTHVSTRSVCRTGRGTINRLNATAAPVVEGTGRRA